MHIMWIAWEEKLFGIPMKNYNQWLEMNVIIVFVTYPLKSRDLFYFFIVYVCWRSLSGILDQIMPDSDLAISCERIYKSSASSTAYIYFSKYEL